MIVYVITDTEAGWDCVRGVYTKRSAAEQYCKERDGDDEDKEWDEDDSTFIIHEETLYE